MTEITTTGEVLLAITASFAKKAVLLGAHRSLTRATWITGLVVGPGAVLAAWPWFAHRR